MEPSFEDRLIQSAENSQRVDTTVSSDEPPKSWQPITQPKGSEGVEKTVTVAPSPSKDSDDPISVDLTPLGDFTFYRPPSTRVAKATAEELSSDFLEPTPDDLKSAQASLISRSKAYQDAPLLTENLRNKRDQEIRNRWPSTTVRIKFADRSMLEKTFPSTYPIKPVYAFVRACLREDAVIHKFVLFETPPRRDLKVSDANVREKSLYDLRLAPRSVLHFRFIEEGVILDPPAGPPPLLSAILARAIDLPLPSSGDAEPSATLPPSERPTSTNTKLTDHSEKDNKIARLLKIVSKSK